MPVTKFVCWRLISKYYLSKSMKEIEKKIIRMFSKQFDLMPTRRLTVKYYVLPFLLPLCHIKRIIYFHLQFIELVVACVYETVYMSRGEFTNILEIRANFEFKSILFAACKGRKRKSCLIFSHSMARWKLMLP